MEILPLPSGPLAIRQDGSGPPLFLLSANPGDHRDFDAIRPALAERYRIVGVDWPGYGQSPAPADPRTASAMLFGRLLREAMEHLDLGPAILVGNSVGGNASVRQALDVPSSVRALVLVSPGGFTPHNAMSRGFCRVKGNEAVTRVTTPLLARLYLRKRNDLVRQILARAAGEQGSPAAVAVNAAVWRSFVDPAHDLRERARKVGVPTWLAFGQHDPIIPASKDGRVAAATIPGAEMHVFGTGHMPFAEDPDAFLAALLPFLDRVGAAGTMTPVRTAAAA